MTIIVSSATVILLLLAGSYAMAVLEKVIEGVRISDAVFAPGHEAMALLRSENLAPSGRDRLLFATAPILLLVSVGVAALVIPLSPRMVAFDPSIGLFYFIVALGPFVIGMMNAGWSANSKVGLFGTFRAAAHLICYEVPLGFAAIGPAMAAQSLSIPRIVEGQRHLWYAVWQPLGVLLFLVSALVMTYRRPFDLPQGSDIGGGVLAEYSGVRLLIMRVSLQAIFLLLMALGVLLFFGGWYGPLLLPPLWFALKTFGLAAAVLLVSRATARLRLDQMLSLSWKILLPASLLNVALVGIVILFMEKR